MRILFIINNYPTKTSKGLYFKHQIDALTTYGHTVDVVLLDKYSFGPSSIENEQVQVLNQPYILKLIYMLVGIKIENKIRKYILNKWITTNADTKYDITVIQPASQFAILFSFFNKKQLSSLGKIIFYEHNYINLNGNKLRKKFRKGYSLADKIYVVSNDKIRQLYLSGMSSLGSRVVNIGNPVNTDSFIPRTTPMKDNEITEVLTVTFDDWIKDPATLLKTIELCTKDKKLVSKVRFTIIGLAPLKSTNLSVAAQEIIALERTGLVRILYNLPNDKMPELYNNSDCFLLTSIQEGMPVSVLEAMASGLPVFSTRCGGVEDIVDPRCGVLVPIGDSQGLYQSIKALSEDKLVYDAGYIRSKISGHYDYQTWVQKFIANA